MMEGDGRLESRRASDIDNDDRVREWEEGLPSLGDLTPLTQCLISPQLASAFSITSDIPPFRSCDDVDRASHSMFAILRNTRSLPIEPSLPHLTQVHTPTDLSPTPRSYHLHAHHSSAVQADDTRLGPPDDDAEALGSAAAPSSDSSEGPTKHVTNAEPEEVESAPGVPDNSTDDATARTLKRPRLVWTPELHKRFIEAVAHLGIKNAVPKTIMQLMNVEGLTRENVASHLQKYRLYLKRMQGLSTEGPTSSDHLFASTPVPPSLAASTRLYAGVPAHLEDIIMQVPYANASVPMPMGRGHADGSTNAAGTFAPMEPFAFNPYVRPPPPRFVQGFPKDAHGMRENPPDSSSHHILRLFPK